MLHLLRLSQDGPHLALSRHRLRAPPSFLSFLVLAFACSSFLGPLTQLPCRALADRRRRRGCRARRAHCATALDAYCRLRAHHVTRDKGKSAGESETDCSTYLFNKFVIFWRLCIKRSASQYSKGLVRLRACVKGPCVNGTGLMLQVYKALSFYACGRPVDASPG